MRTTIAVLLTLAALCGAPRLAHAGVFVSITQGASTTTCDTAGACGAGWSILGPNDLLFTGTVGGYAIAALDVSANVPGSGTVAESLDTKNHVTNVSAPGGSLVIDTAAYGFVSPLGATVLSAAQTANWAIAAPGDGATFAGAGCATNATAWPCGTLAPTPAITNATADTSTAFSRNSLDVAFATGAGPYSLQSRAVITQAVGSVGAFTGTVLTLGSGRDGGQVPEPGAVFLVGTGLLWLARGRARRR